MTLPIVPYAEAGPLYGLVLPILISVAVTPGVSAAIVTAGARASAAISALGIVLLSMMSSCRGSRRLGRMWGPILLRATVRHACRFRGARRAPGRGAGRRRCR